jgi:hypothetical protein
MLHSAPQTVHYAQQEHTVQELMAPPSNYVLQANTTRAWAFLSVSIVQPAISPMSLAFHLAQLVAQDTMLALG